MTRTHFVFVSTEDDRHLVKGGIGTYLGVLTRTLARRGHHPDWITQSPSPEDFIQIDGRVRRHYLARRSCDEFLERLDRTVERIVRDALSADPATRVIVESPDWEGLLADAFARWGTAPRILRLTRLHTPLAVCMESNRLPATPENERQVARERRQMEHSDLLSSPTRYTLDATTRLALDGRPPCPTVVIGNCVDADLFRPALATPAEALARLRALTGVSLGRDAFRLFVVGSVEYRKGVAILQRALPSLLALRADVEVCWLGHYLDESGTQLSANAKLTPDAFYAPIPKSLRKRVHLAGHVPHDELSGIYAAGDLFVFCYLTDNFPGALTEVALSDRPMVVLMRGGLPEIVAHGERPLALALTADTEAGIATQLVELVRAHLGDRRPAIDAAAELRNRVLSHFGADAIVGAMEEVYGAALIRKSSAHDRDAGGRA